MASYVPPEKMTVESVQKEIDYWFSHWNDVHQNGCADPFWPDGVNLNLTRNHIIYYYGLLQDKLNVPVQLSLFGTEIALKGMRPVPPEVSDWYMAPNQKYPERVERIKQMQRISRGLEGGEN